MYCGSVQVLLNCPACCCETCVRGLAALQAFQRWKDGRTGLPLVDANMRELAETGVLHPTPSAPHVTLREWKSNRDSMNLRVYSVKIIESPQFFCISVVSSF